MLDYYCESWSFIIYLYELKFLDLAGFNYKLIYIFFIT